MIVAQVSSLTLVVLSISYQHRLRPYHHPLKSEHQSEGLATVVVICQ